MYTSHSRKKNVSIYSFNNCRTKKKKKNTELVFTWKDKKPALNGTNNCSRTIYFQTGLELSASLSMTGPKPIKQVDLFSKINKKIKHLERWVMSHDWSSNLGKVAAIDGSMCYFDLILCYLWVCLGSAYFAKSIINKGKS